MSADLIETLPLPQRLALSYAPRQAHAPTLALLALDTRLAGIVRSGGEPVIAQMKLAWWRERFGQSQAEWPLGEPLLTLLRESGIEHARMAPLVDGWEALLSEQLGRSELAAFSRGRALAWAAVGDAAGNSASNEPVERAARAWALADLALNLGEASEADLTRAALRAEVGTGVRLPRQLRSLAVLYGLANRAIAAGTNDMLDGPAAMAVALRIGLLGR